MSKSGLNTDLGFFIQQNQWQGVNRLGGSIGKDWKENRLCLSTSKVSWKNAQIWEDVGEDVGISFSTPKGQKAVLSFYSNHIDDSLSVFNGYEIPLAPSGLGHFVFGVELIDAQSGQILEGNAKIEMSF